MLKGQRLLGAVRIQPVGDEPVFVAVRVAGPAGGQDVRQPPRCGQRQADVFLPVQVRLVTADQQDFAGNIGGGRRGEGSRDVADVDSVQAPVGGQRTFEEQRVPVNGIAPGSTLITPPRRRITHCRSEDTDMLFGLGLVRAVEV